MSNILIKVATLNDFYSTHILNIFEVTKHIKNIKKLDDRLQSGDEKLVNEIAKVGLKNKNGEKIIFYSFAMKFYSHYNNEDFAIYDSYVEKILMYFRKYNFSDNKFTKKDENTQSLKKFYLIFVNIINEIAI